MEQTTLEHNLQIWYRKEFRHLLLSNLSTGCWFGLTSVLSPLDQCNIKLVLPQFKTLIKTLFVPKKPKSKRLVAKSPNRLVLAAMIRDFLY